MVFLPLEIKKYAIVTPNAKLNKLIIISDMEDLSVEELTCLLLSDEALKLTIEVFASTIFSGVT